MLTAGLSTASTDGTGGAVSLATGEGEPTTSGAVIIRPLMLVLQV